MRWPLLTVAVLAPAIPLLAAAPLQIAPRQIEVLLTSVYPHGLPLTEARRALRTAGAADYLIGVLADEGRADRWENATLLLGLSGDPKAKGTLLEFFSRDDSPAGALRRCQLQPNCRSEPDPTASRYIPRQIYYAKSNVPTALGLWLSATALKGRSDPQRRVALDFLTRCASLSETSHFPHWSTDVFEDRPLLQADLSIQCIEGLGLSGDADAREFLRARRATLGAISSGEAAKIPEELIALRFPAALATPAFLATSIATLDDSLKTSAMIGRVGVDRYYGQQPSSPTAKLVHPKIQDK